MKVIESKDAPEAIGPYSQAIACKGELVFVSGQIPVDRKTGKFAGETIEEQTEQSLKNIEYILKEAGLDMSNVVDVTVLLKDMNDFAAMNGVYAKHFNGNYPARAAFEVGALPKGALVEIKVTACKE